MPVHGFQLFTFAQRFHMGDLQSPRNRAGQWSVWKAMPGSTVFAQRWMSVLGGSLLILAGCASKPDDKQLAQTVQAAVARDSAITGGVTVASLHGLITLRGQVSSDAARVLAGRDAAAVRGVTGVVNVLTIGAPVEAGEASAPVGEARPVRERRRKERPAQDLSVPVPRPVASSPQPAPPVSSARVPATVRPVETTASVPPPPSTPPPTPAPVKHTIPAGSVVSVRLIESLDSRQNKAGDTFRATLNAPIREGGEVVIPAGANVEGRVADASNAGRFSGHAELRLELTKLTSHGTAYSLQTESYQRAGDGRGKGTAETVGAGAALGAIIGAVAGGGRGAAIGTMAGAGAGGGARGVEKRDRVYFPSETVLTFKLQEPVTVVGGDTAEPSRTVLAR